MVLEIVNSCLVHQTQHNPNLIYALLYKRELFEAAGLNPGEIFKYYLFNISFFLAFSDLAANLLAVVVHMGSRLEQVLWMFCVNVFFCDSHTKDLLSA